MEKAIFELNDKLKHPSDVENKLDSILDRYRSKNNKEVDNLHSACNTYIHGIKDTFTTLKDIKEVMLQLKAHKEDCTKILSGSKYILNEYKTIKEISIAHENFCKIQRFIENLNKTDEDLDDKDIEEQARIVFENDEFACDLKQYNYEMSSEESIIVERKLNSIKKASVEFTSCVMHIFSDYVQNIHIFQKMNQIIDKEEERDNIIRKVKEGENSDDPVKRQYFISYSKYINSEPKDLKKKVVNVIKSSIKAKFNAARDKRDVFENLSFIFDDLNELCTGNTISFFSFEDFCIEYHSSLKWFIENKLRNIEPEDILGIIEFKAYYYDRFQKDFKKIPESLGPRLIENEGELLTKYSNIASSKLKTWIDNISMIEIQKFTSRDPEINRDEEGKLVSSGFINLLQIIKAQLEPISFNKKIFLVLTNIIKDNCVVFKEKIQSALQSELKNVLENKKLHGFEDYCIMFGNSGLRLTRYISSLPFFQSDEVRNLQQIFLGILKDSNSILCEYIIDTCKPALSKIFTSEWKKNKKKDVFIITLDDFLQDYSKTMSEYTFSTFVCELCTKIYNFYKKSLVSSKISLDMHISKALKDDFENIVGVLKKYLGREKFESFLAPMLKFCPLMDTTNGELFVYELKSMILSDTDIKQSFIESFISMRKDMDDDEKNIVLSKLPEIFSMRKTKKKTLISKFLSKK